MSFEPPPTKLQRWLYRRRGPVRVACVVFLLTLIAWAVDSFIVGRVMQGVLAVFMCGCPVGLLASARSVERLITRHDAASKGAT